MLASAMLTSMTSCTGVSRHLITGVSINSHGRLYFVLIRYFLTKFAHTSLTKKVNNRNETLKPSWNYYFNGRIKIPSIPAQKIYQELGRSWPFNGRANNLSIYCEKKTKYFARRRFFPLFSTTSNFDDFRFYESFYEAARILHKQLKIFELKIARTVHFH